MKKNITAIAVLLAGLTATGQALADETSAVSTYGNLTFTNDYMFRGISVTERYPAVQGYIHFVGGAGLYGGLWMSNVSGSVYQGGSSEMYFYGGKNWDIGSGFTLDTGAAFYHYPSASYASIIDGTEVKYDTTELKIGIKKSYFEAVLWYGVSKEWAGFDFSDDYQKTDMSGTTYIEFNANPELAKGVTLNLHAGHQALKDNKDWSWSDAKIGVTMDVSGIGLKGWTFSAAVVHSDADEALYDLINIEAGTAGNFSLSKNF